MLGRAEMVDEDCGSGRWEQNSPTKNDRVNGKRSECLPLSFIFTYYIVEVF